MAMPDKDMVVQRLRKNGDYRRAFDDVFCPHVLDQTDEGFGHTAKALAAYQLTKEFAPFDSKLGRSLRDEATLTVQKELGYTVFITWKCRLCHMLRKQG